MNAKRIALTALSVAMALAALSVVGCSKKLKDSFLPDTPPEVRLTAAPYDTSRATPYFYAYRMNWIGFDPDGRIDYFLYAVDPPSSGPIPWVRTTKNEQIIFFTADSSSANTQLATRPHIFALCAVDDRGDTSTVIQRGFFSYTQCPTVTITNPTPSSLTTNLVTPAVRVTWQGADPDGQLTSKPIKYKYLMLSPSSSFPVDQAILHPDSLRNYYAYDWARHGLPGPWAGWDSTSADTTFKQFTNLTPNTPYLFVVIAFDEAGAFSPVFSLDQNMIRLLPGYASSLGPKITLFNEFFNFTYPSGGWTKSPQAQVNLEVPANQPITFNWSAEPPKGAAIETYRWMLDGDPENDATRDTASVFTKWSERSLNTTSATVGPFAGGTTHDFWVEAADNNGLVSLGHVFMTVVQASFARPLLVVSDVRIQPEKVLGFSCPKSQPTLAWPNAAELDTFLFARGNVPWDCYVGNPAPGLFNGYDYEAYHTSTVNLDKTVKLATLGTYRNVVWLTDGINISANEAGLRAYGGGYALRYMSAPGRVNTLGAYMRQGGKLWIVGGGAAYALCKDLFNSTNNDIFAFTYSNRQPTELQPGRFMYDIAHWRSELQVYAVTNPQIKRSSRAVGGWNNQLAWAGNLSAPDYSLLPATLDPKTPATDPLPPSRVNDSKNFYRTSGFSYPVEYLDQPNSILEDVNPDPVLVNEVSTLDTLMKTEAVLAANYRAYERGGPGVPGSIPGTPVMTYYHGLEFPQFVFSGFDLWNYQQAELQQLVDFVLQQIFGLTKNAPLASPARALRAAPPVWSPPAHASRTVSAGRGAPVTSAPAASLRPGSHE